MHIKYFKMNGKHILLFVLKEPFSTHITCIKRHVFSLSLGR